MEGAVLRLLPRAETTCFLFTVASVSELPLSTGRDDVSGMTAEHWPFSGLLGCIDVETSGITL